MRARATWLNILALFALVLAQVPASAIAALLSSASCTMPCCQAGRHEMPVSEKVADRDNCGKCPIEAKRATQVRVADLDCKCVIRSGSLPDRTPVAAAFTPTAEVFEVVAVIPSEHVHQPTIADRDRQSGIRGSDSDPFVSRPQYASFGRAPPVLLA